MCDWYIIIIVSTLLNRVIINKKYIYKSTYKSSINLKITKNIGELVYT